MHLKISEDLLKSHEGLRLKAYKCTAGKNTIGYGRNLDDAGISKQEAELLLKSDIAKLENALNQYAWYRSLNEARKAALIDMAYNLGLSGLLTFKGFISLLTKGNYKEAASEMLKSKWAAQVGKRALDLSKIISEGLVD